MAKRISQLPAETSPAVGDELPLYDLSTGTTKRATLANLLLGVTAGTLISDAAIKAKHVDISVADQTARDAITSPWEGLLVYREDTDKQQIYDGAAWRTLAGWELLGVNTLTVAGDTLSATSLPNRKHLRVCTIVASTGGTINQRMRINNDSGTNYAQGYSVNFGAITTITSGTGIELNPTTSASEVYSTADIQNVSTRRKLIKAESLDDNNASATTSCNSIKTYGKWDESTNPISRIDVLNFGGGDFAIGSTLIVIGADFA